MRVIPYVRYAVYDLFLGLVSIKWIAPCSDSYDNWEQYWMGESRIWRQNGIFWNYRRDLYGEELPKSKVSKEKNEHLIELVWDHTLLYKPGVPEHKDGQLTLNTRRSIAEILAIGKCGVI